MKVMSNLFGQSPKIILLLSFMKPQCILLHIVALQGLTRFHPYLADGVDMVDDLSSYRYSVDNVYWAHLELKHTKKRRRVVLATTK